jgi:hypothetical protein
MAKDIDLDPLRQRGDFKQLLAESLAKRPANTPPPEPPKTGM